MDSRPTRIAVSLPPVDSGPPFELERTGVAMIAAFGFLLMPLTLLWTMWRLTHGFEPQLSTPVELAFTVLSVLLMMLTLYLTARELRGAVGMRIDASGIACGRNELRWEQVESLGTPRFGQLELRGGQVEITVHHYLFAESKRVLDYIGERSGASVSERWRSR